MTLRKIARVTILLSILLLAAVACQGQPSADEGAEDTGGGAAAADETTFERAQRTGFVRVGFANENPYAYATPDGQLTGEAVEVARAVFSNLGIEEMDGVLTEFGSLIPGLQANRFDVITAGMYIRPERCEQVLFADPEYRITEGMIVEAGNPHGLTSYEDVAANPDVKIGTGAGWAEYDYMTTVGVPDSQIVTFPDGPAGVAGILAGQVDAFTGTGPTMQTLIQTTADAGIELVTDFEDPIIDGQPAIAYGGAAFRLQDEDFREAFNAELQKLKDSGELLEIIGQFEGFTENELPGDVTAEDVCPEQYGSE